MTRWLYWLDALEKATPQDFPRLVRLAQGNSTAMRFVAARWVEVDPRHMFDTLVAASSSNNGFPVNELATVLFNEWTKRDPKAVVEALNSAEKYRSGAEGFSRCAIAGCEHGSFHGSRRLPPRRLRKKPSPTLPSPKNRPRLKPSPGLNNSTPTRAL